MTYYTDLPNNSSSNSSVSARDAASQLIAGAGAMAGAARAGQFAVNETGGQALLKAIGEMRQWYVSNIDELRYLRQVDGYGTSHGAQVVQPYMGQVAGDERGLVTVLIAMDQALAEAETAIHDAMRNYQHTETHNADAGRKLTNALEDGSRGPTYYV